MAYTTIDNPEDYFITHTYSGNNTTNNQTSLGMTPDLVWVKSRNTGSPTQHYIVDKVRGDEEYIISNSTAAEATDSNTFALVSGGFNLDGSNGWTNLTGRTFVAWNWKAGGSGSANTTGDINSTVSVNTDAGFSIIKYEGSGTDGDDVGHGIGATPSVILLKQYSQVSGWRVYHSSIHASSGEDKNLFLQDSDANTTDIDTISGVSSTVFTLKDTNGNGATNNSGGDFIAYAWTPVQGYSKFGSYVGNGSTTNGPFIYTGFLPAFVMIKCTSAVSDWWIWDSKREPNNLKDLDLYPNLQTAEDTSLGSNGPDFLSNGFKFQSSGVTAYEPNVDGAEYIYMAFAEAPFVNSNGVPCNAR